MIPLPTEDTSILEAAEQYALMGLMPIRIYGMRNGRCACGNPRCEERSWAKHPFGMNWTKEATLDLDKVRANFTGWDGNIGIYLGEQFVLVDLDGPAAIEWARDLPPTLTSESGSGNGEHRIYRLAPSQDPKSITDRRIERFDDGGVDIKVRGQFVAPPSLHRSGRKYKWVNAAPIATLPDDLFARIKRPTLAVVGAVAQADAHKMDRARKYIAKMPDAVSGDGGHQATWNVARVLVKDFGLDDASALVILREYNTARCKPPWSEKELLHKLEDAKTAHTVNPKDPVMNENWQERIMQGWRKTKQVFLSNTENVIVMLSFDPRWKGKIRFDELAGQIRVYDPPWYDYQGKSEEFWTDNDTARLDAWFQREWNGYQFAPSRNQIDAGVNVVAKAHAFHPVRDYFEGLKWDGVERLSTWLTTYGGVEDTPYARAVGRWWLISAVARTMHPGAKADYVLILEGPQGRGKSGLLERLASTEWFMDTPIDLNNKDSFGNIQGALIVELAELDSLFRTEASRSKAFFSGKIDKFRRAYEKYDSRNPRSCIFAGTINPVGDSEAQYLRDPTGNRRYWPVKCTVIDLVGAARDRDQIWAEAVLAYKAGEKWYPSTEAEFELTRIEQELRTDDDDPWEAIITQYLQDEKDDFISTAEVLGFAVGLELSRQDRRAQMRISATMRKLGWKHARREVNGVAYRGWERPPTSNGNQGS